MKVLSPELFNDRLSLSNLTPLLYKDKHLFLLNSITWKGKHLYKTRFFTSKITEMKPFETFTDTMVKRDFKSFEHRHFFKPVDSGTIVIDITTYETPYGWLGEMVNKFYLNSFLEKLIETRNKVIRQYAETDKWRALLSNRR